MSTTINRTDGTTLTTIADGAIDTSTTDLSFIGRLYRNYGELVNENFIRLLENFADSSAPSAPIEGQLWFDRNTKRLNVFRTTGFVPLSINTTSGSQPNTPSIGDLWYDTVDEQLKVYTGSEWRVIAPAYSATQGKSGFFVETISDISFQNHIAVVSYQGGIPTTIISRDSEYTPRNSITGFATVKRGINLSSLTGFHLHGTATNADTLDTLDSGSFLRSDVADVAAGTIDFTNPIALRVGAAGDLEVGYNGANIDFRKVNSGKIRFFADTNNQVFETNDSQQLALMDGTANLPALSFIDDPDTGISRSGPNVLALSAGGTVRMTVSSSGAGVIGTMSATAFAGNASGNTAVFQNVTVPNNLTAPNISGVSNFLNGATFTGTMTTLGASVLGNDLSDTVTINAGTISVPNGTTFENGEVQFDSNLLANANLVVGVDAVISRDLLVNDDLFVSDELLVQYDSVSGHSALRVTSTGQVLVNATGPKVSSSNPGDLTLGDFNTVYAANTAKYWVSWQDDDITSGQLSASGVGVVGSTTSNNATSGSLPSGLQEDDVVFCFSGSDDGSPAIPSGYTEVTSGTSNSVTYQVSYKVMTSTPDTTASGLTATNQYVFTAVRGVDLSDIIGDFSSIASGASGMPDAPSLSTTEDNTLVFAVGWLDDAAPPSVSPPAGFQLAGAEGRTVNGQGGSTMVGFRRYPEQETANPGAFSAASDNTGPWLGYTFAVNLSIPAGSGFQILNSYHVDSVTRLSTGVYRINLEYALTDSSYYAVIGMGSATNMNIQTFPVGGTYIEIETEDYAASRSNINTYMSVVVYGY